MILADANQKFVVVPHAGPSKVPAVQRVGDFGEIYTAYQAAAAQGQSLTLNFNGTVDGDALTGEFGSDFGAFGVTGTRQ